MVTVDNINVNNVIRDGESDVSFAVSGFSGEIISAIISGGGFDTVAMNVMSVAGSGLFDLPSISEIVDEIVGASFTTIDNEVTVTLGDGVDSASIVVDYLPLQFWEMTQVVGAVKTDDSIFELVPETVSNGSYIYYSSMENTGFEQDGSLTTSNEGDFYVKWWDKNTGIYHIVDVISSEFMAYLGYIKGDAEVGGFHPETSTYAKVTLTNPVNDDAYINDAIVKLTVKYLDTGLDVAGVDWPITLQFIGESGSYALTLDPIAQQKIGAIHDFVYEYSSGVLQGKCSKHVRSTKGRCF